MTQTIYVAFNGQSKKFSPSNSAHATQSLTIQDGIVQSPIKEEQMTVPLKKEVAKIIKAQTEAPKKPKKEKAVKAHGAIILSKESIEYIASVDKDTKLIKDTQTTRDTIASKMILHFKDEMTKVQSIGGFELTSKTRAKTVAHAMSEKAEQTYTKGVVAAIKYHYEEGHKIPNEYLTVANIKALKYARQNELISRNAACKPATDYKAFIDGVKAKNAKHRAAEMAKRLTKERP